MMGPVGVHHKKSTWLNYQCQLACFCDGLRSSSSQKINLVKLPMSTCRFLWWAPLDFITEIHVQISQFFFMEALMSNLRYWPSQNGVYETLEASQKRSQQDDVVLRWSWVDFITKSSVPACSFKGQCMWMEICKKTMSKPLLLWLTPINLIRKLVWQKDLHFVMNHSFKWVCFVIFFLSRDHWSKASLQIRMARSKSIPSDQSLASTTHNSRCLACLSKRKSWLRLSTSRCNLTWFGTWVWQTVTQE